MAEAPGGLRKRALRLFAIPFLALLVVAMGLQAVTAAPGNAIRQPDLLLRLHDLPPGYLDVELQEGQGERTFCSRLHRTRSAPKALGSFIDRFHPKGCVGTYYRLFSVPNQPLGPVLAGTGVLRMDSGKAADAAWHVIPEILGRLTNDPPPREVARPKQVGSATRLFHFNAQPRIYPFFPKVGRTTSFLVWRSGNTLAVVMAIGESFGEVDGAVAQLARRQQAHIRKPTPYTRAERFDGEVALDDPALETPVYWLGRNFRPSNGLPDNRLFGSASSDGSDEELPGSLLAIGYQTIRLYTWTQATWPQYVGTRAGNAITTWHCTKTKTIAVPGGYATIYGGFKENYRRCPGDPPKAFTARVYIGDQVIAVNPIPLSLPGPFGPFPLFIETANPYGSFKGMEAIVRGLRLRPKPLY